MDSQECPTAEISIVALVVETIKALVNGKFADHETQMKCRTEGLAQILDLCIEKGEQAVLRDADYLKLFGLSAATLSASEFWKHILERLVYIRSGVLDQWKPELDLILQEGTLSTRILKALHADRSPDSIRTVYRNLSDCLAQNKLFLP
jgi:carboxylate-amine ligase